MGFESDYANGGLQDEIEEHALKPHNLYFSLALLLSFTSYLTVVNPLFFLCKTKAIDHSMLDRLQFLSLSGSFLYYLKKMTFITMINFEVHE
ncbi:hypothetical protein JHK82_018527 [Glycine max]|uniref:Uncharacterized protein n=1 Tax=Glycine soja TaxID=3848 RepID=A0A0B2PBW3_GLYSO|nr:hypothetical protein JHK85_018958 [Glycine max]KAG5037716.1 hypothetical protein JHK86_018556 [Glycine max]KAG5142832.1 hypothetical protein JHK82_018527 [Glycine max]KHN05132.1 hypothetical protein glysoja_034958 [Glycine soja]